MMLPGQETLLRSWRARQLACRPAPEWFVAPRSMPRCFPAWAPLNNAILLDGDQRIATIAASELESLYSDAGVDAWALWVPSAATNLDAPEGIQAVGRLTRDTTTLVMQGTLRTSLRLHGGALATSIATATRASYQPVPVADLMRSDPMPGLNGWVLVRDELAVAGAWSFLDGTECGLYAVGTSSNWRHLGVAREHSSNTSSRTHTAAARARQAFNRRGWDNVSTSRSASSLLGAMRNGCVPRRSAMWAHRNPVPREIEFVPPQTPRGTCVRKRGAGRCTFVARVDFADGIHNFARAPAWESP